MHKLQLTLACGRYDRTQALIDGRVQPEGVDLTFLPLRPGETFWRMLNHGEVDASEMSLSSYTILRSEGDARFIAIPVFPSRAFRHSALYVRSDATIESPEDLKGKRVGVGDYQMTASTERASCGSQPLRPLPYCRSGASGAKPFPGPGRWRRCSHRAECAGPF